MTRGFTFCLAPFLRLFLRILLLLLLISNKAIKYNKEILN
jgi:hypothetical protein